MTGAVWRIHQSPRTDAGSGRSFRFQQLNFPIELRPLCSRLADGFAPGFGWGTIILPFVEQRNLADMIDLNNDLFGNGVVMAIENVPPEFSSTPLPLFRCPSDNGEELTPAGFARSNYQALSLIHI